MKIIKPNWKNNFLECPPRAAEDGLTIIGTLALSLILSLALTGILSVTSTEASLSRQLNHSMRALFMSEAGISLGEGHLWNLVSNPPAGTATLYPFGTSPLSPPGGGSGTYEVSIAPDADNPTNDMKMYTVQSIGESDDRLRTIETDIQMESFAKFAYFSNNEYNSFYGFNIWFTSSDVIQGPLHSNDQISIYNNPVFLGLVSSTASSFNYYHGGPPADNPTFDKGYELGADPVVLPIDLSILTDKVASGGLQINSDSLITLNSDGTMTYTDGLGGNVTSQTINLSAINGTVFVDGVAAVKGTLNGRLTIGSSDDMLIVDNIVYNTDPTVDPASTDTLGLVSEKNVEVWKNAPYDVEVNGVLMALENSFEVQDWDKTSNLKGTLSIFGGLIQEFRGPVGTFYSSTGQKRSGYTKNYSYDTRMRTNPPPGFPLTGHFERVAWREV